MKFQKLLLSIVAIFTLLTLSACSSTGSSDKVAGERTNILGIYTSESDSYAPVSPISGTVSYDELGSMELPTGRKVTWLWGLITYVDY